MLVSNIYFILRHKKSVQHWCGFHATLDSHVEIFVANI